MTLSASNGIGPSASQSFTLTVGEAPGISSSAAATFTVGGASTFTIAPTGHPAPTVAIAGSLPSGVVFDPATGLLSGKPASGSEGTYPLTLTATNGVGAPAVQAFTLTVTLASSISSAASTTFSVGSVGSFTVTAEGLPKPTLSLAGLLPAGVVFDAATGGLSGVPAAGTGGPHALTITATNGVGSPATQAFTLIVNEAAVIRSAALASFTTAASGSFTVAASGYPTPALTIAGALPAGIAFDPASGLLAGTPAPGSAGSYALTITATNGVGLPATQAFTLAVDRVRTSTVLAGTSPRNSVVGQPVTVSFAVSAVPPLTGVVPGSVVVSDGVDSCSAPVAAGQCTLVLTTAGRRTLTVSYGGSPDALASASSVPHEVVQASTTISVTAHAPEPSTVGTPLTVSFAVAALAPGAALPTGQVTVSDGVDSCTVPAATGSCSLTLHTTGLRTLTASFAGDPACAGSTVAVAHRVADEKGLARGSVLWQGFFAIDPHETPMVGDFDGDGRADIVTFTRDDPAAHGDVYVALSLGDRFDPAPQRWHDWFAVDPTETIVIGDFDGDGRDDVATWLGAGSRQVYVALSNGHLLLPEDVWLDAIGSSPSDVLRAGDVNGDGRADLVLFARAQGKVYVALSEGSRFAAPQQWHGFFAVSTHERPLVADLNGDGRADIITLGTDSPTAFGDVYVATSDGVRFVDLAGNPDSSSKWHDWFAISPAERVAVGDQDGDGRADLFTFLPPPWGQCYTVRSLGTGLGPNVLWPDPLRPLATDLPWLGDANGDGKADVIVFAQSEGRVYVSLAP